MRVTMTLSVSTGTSATALRILLHFLSFPLILTFHSVVLHIAVHPFHFHPTPFPCILFYP